MQFGFLPVGHTHEDIDAFHSRHSIKLRSKGHLTGWVAPGWRIFLLIVEAEFMTVDAMMSVIRLSHSRGVTVQKLWAQRNYRDWMKAHIQRIPNIRDFRQFRIAAEVRVPRAVGPCQPYEAI